MNKAADGLTIDEYWAKFRARGVTPCARASYGRVLCETSDGQFIQVPDPQELMFDERMNAFDIVCAIHGLQLLN